MKLQTAAGAATISERHPSLNVIYTIDIGPNLFQLLQLYFVVRYVVPALVGGTLLVVAVFFIRYLLRQPDLDWRDFGLWKFAAAGAALAVVLTCAVLVP